MAGGTPAARRRDGPLRARARARYAEARDAAELPRYRLALALAGLGPPPPPLAAAMATWAGDPAGTGRFLGAIAGTVPVGEVFGPAMA